MCVFQPSIPDVPDIRELPPAPPATPSALGVERAQGLIGSEDVIEGQAGTGFGIESLMVKIKQPQPL